MGTIDVNDFANDAFALALRFESGDLPGLLGKKMTVPAETVALVRGDEGSERISSAGTEESGHFGVVLVKPRDQSISFECDELRTRSGRPTRAGVEVLVRLPERAIDIRSLSSTLLKDSQRLSVDDLRAYLRPWVQEGLHGFVGGRSAEELMLEDPRDELDRVLREALKGAAFSAGLEVLEVRHPSFYSEDFEQLREARRKATEAEEELKRSEQLRELKVRVERNEKLKEHEVEEFAKVLRYRGVLKELSLKQELSRKRNEEDLRRFEAIHKQVGEDDLKAMIFLLEDDKLKARLIQQLIERDMSAEQLRAKKAAEQERHLEERLASFAEQMGALTGERRRRISESGTRTRRVLLAHGKQALAFDPATNLRREAPKEVYDLAEGELGYVRSVRMASTTAGEMVLVGAQGGVYALPEGGDLASARVFTFPEPPKGQGGVNATAYFDGWLYATHSELGLLRWDLAGLVRPEPLFAKVTSRHESTRGVLVTPNGRLVFASGPNLYMSDLLRPQQPLSVYRGTEASITAFAANSDELFAGTRTGRVLRWSVTDPGSPRELGIRKASAIYMLRTAELDGAPHLLVGAKEHGVTAVSLADGRAVDYRAPDQIRWVDGATDLVFGVTRGGYAMHVWEAQQLERVLFTVHLTDRVQDLHVVKEPYGDLS